MSVTHRDRPSPDLEALAQAVAALGLGRTLCPGTIPWTSRSGPERDTALLQALALPERNQESGLRPSDVRPAVLAALVDRLLAAVDPVALEARITLGLAMGAPEPQVLLEHRAWRRRRAARPDVAALGQAALWLAGRTR